MRNTESALICPRCADLPSEDAWHLPDLCRECAIALVEVAWHGVLRRAYSFRQETGDVVLGRLDGSNDEVLVLKCDAIALLQVLLTSIRTQGDYEHLEIARKVCASHLGGLGR